MHASAKSNNTQLSFGHSKIWLFDRVRLAVALHYTEFQAIFSSPEISMTQRASFSPRMDARG